MSDVRIEQESAKDLTISVRKPRLRYLDELMRLKCAPDLLPFFPNAKEITESFAAYSAVRQIVHNVEWLDLGDDNVHLWSLCDGHQPRTAATFAFRSSWVCFSVDPELRGLRNLSHLPGRPGPGGLDVPGVDRAYGFPQMFSHPRVVDRFNRSLYEASAVVVVMVHPHIRLHEVQDAVDKVELEYVEDSMLLQTPVVVIHIPCCVGEDDEIWNGPAKEYDDWGIHSPKRTVRIFPSPWTRVR